jgi:hypothetical protein
MSDTEIVIMHDSALVWSWLHWRMFLDYKYTLTMRKCIDY